MREEQPQVRSATCRASCAERLAAAATRTLASTATHLPTKPAAPEQTAPSKNDPVVRAAGVDLQGSITHGQVLHQARWHMGGTLPVRMIEVSGAQQLVVARRDCMGAGMYGMKMHEINAKEEMT